MEKMLEKEQVYDIQWYRSNKIVPMLFVGESRFRSIDYYLFTRNIDEYIRIKKDPHGGEIIGKAIDKSSGISDGKKIILFDKTSTMDVKIPIGLEANIRALINKLDKEGT